MKALLPLLMLAAASCSTVKDAPSLAPRPSENIDPRLPVADTSASVPADAALAAQLAALVQAAGGATARFEVAIARAEQLAGVAGPRQSDSWVAAQQALSAAVAERYPVTRALADIDALATARVVGGGQLNQADQQAVREAGAGVEAINARQAARVAAVQRRLGG